MKQNPSSTITRRFEKHLLVLPIICPHCSTVCDPIVKTVVTTPEVYLAVVTAHCCEVPFFTLHKPTHRKDGIQYSDLISVYPQYLSKAFSKHLTDFSPRFVDLYNQAYAAEQSNHHDLAGSGYRNALEVLIKDFAINLQKEDPSKVNDIPLVQAINKYYPVPEAQGLAHISRILGNDFTHYKQKYTEVEFQSFKQYVDGAIQIIDLYVLSSIPLSSE